MASPAAGALPGLGPVLAGQVRYQSSARGLRPLGRR